NAAAQSTVALVGAGKALKDSDWHHYAFTFDSAKDLLNLFVDGRQTDSRKLQIRRLDSGDEDYMSVGRNGRWDEPLPGILDELRFSKGLVYRSTFEVPGSFSPPVPNVTLLKGPPLRFGSDSPKRGVVELGGSKHVFWDDSLLESSKGITFSTHQPKYITRVVEGMLGQVRKHLTVIEDEQGMIRIYHGVADDYLGIRVSHDGVNFVTPDTGFHWKGDKNIVIPEPAPLGRPIIDP
ncbi:MAG: hypothetical protein KJT03_24775, partial [Verrucomicrobiae bacterium]|nr:hypothetical protein [Verrucomicrobiae bacterium]